MKTVLLSLVAVVVLMLSCGKEPSREELAGQAAKACYDHLIAGRYDEFVAATAGTDSLPASYREQLVVNARQFAAIQKSDHGGIGSVEVLRAKTDSLSGQTCVFLMMCFGDSTREEIVVPMVEQNGRWMMR